MPRSEHVHWHEGLFLQPHHLQALQRFILDQSAGARSATCPYPYGVVSHELSTDALKNLRVQFDHLHVVLRSGLEVIYPGNAELAPLELGGKFGGTSDRLSVELVVPSWQPQGANAVAADATDGWGSRYRVREIEQYDENSGTNPQPIPVRRLNAWLSPGDEKRPGVESLPVLRVLMGADGMPRVDDSYIPPCLTGGGSATLRSIVMGVSDQLQARRKEMLPKLTRDGFALSALSVQQIGDLMWLRITSHYGATLPAMARATAVTPFQLYLELAALYGDLVALHPAEADLFDVPDYNHDNLALCFYELAKHIGDWVGAKKHVEPLVVTFKPDGALLTAELNEQHLTRPERYYLAIKNGGSPDDVANLIKDKNVFKLMSKEEALQIQAIWGVKLEPVWSTPDGVPNGPVYFRLALEDPDSKKRWAKITAPTNRNVVALKFPVARLSREATVQLVMPLPAGAK